LGHVEMDGRHALALQRGACRIVDAPIGKDREIGHGVDLGTAEARAQESILRSARGVSGRRLNRAKRDLHD
jgi:hypothetical protein